jgi:hypothetical protein
MMIRGSAISSAMCLALLLSLCAFASGPSHKIGTDIIVTAAPVYVPLAELRGQERFPRGAQLLLIHEGSAEPLVTVFAASADANVSFDGKLVLFAGKKAAGDPWQIWELALQDRSVRKVITTSSDAERPFYLPGGRMVWAARTTKGFQLQSAEDKHQLKHPELTPAADPGLLSLSESEVSAFPSDVLQDGRILFESGFPLGSGASPELYMVYADGSGVEAYRCDHGRARWGGTQLASGDIVFTHGTSLARFASPWAHEGPITAPYAQYAGSIAETSSGAWLLSTRMSSAAHYALRLWKPGSTTSETVLVQSSENLVEPVLVTPRDIPKRHPSGLHPWNYANLLALDARLSRDGNLKAAPASVRLEKQDATGRAIALGTAPVEQDGSFFVQVPGDTPIRFALLNAKGEVLRRERGWFWARGGEQRICGGCHTGPERGAENRVPAVLLRGTTPVDLTGSSRAPSQLASQEGR